MLVFINYWIEKCTVKHWNSVIIFGLDIDRLGRYKKERVKKGVKLTTAEGKNEWSHTSTPPVCLRGTVKENFALLPLPYEFHYVLWLYFSVSFLDRYFIVFLWRYRVIQEESAILWEMIVCLILSKKVHNEHGSDFERLPRYGKKKIRTILRARTAIT